MSLPGGREGTAAAVVCSPPCPSWVDSQRENRHRRSPLACLLPSV